MPSDFRPSRIKLESTPIAGITTRIGVDLRGEAGFPRPWPGDDGRGGTADGFGRSCGVGLLAGVRVGVPAVGLAGVITVVVGAAVPSGATPLEGGPG
ncbi:hypothetical protein GCM10009741_08850 [Kribbella lupini]|uniref:Uncharacterized protein n=1 Tax=Kribbella lupini TaxID=291602 RepID=A0ABP4L300_9ACTN